MIFKYFEVAEPEPAKKCKNCNEGILRGIYCAGCIVNDLSHIERWKKLIGAENE